MSTFAKIAATAAIGVFDVAGPAATGPVAAQSAALQVPAVQPAPPVNSQIDRVEIYELDGQPTYDSDLFQTWAAAFDAEMGRDVFTDLQAGQPIEVSPTDTTRTVVIASRPLPFFDQGLGADPVFDAIRDYEGRTVRADQSSKIERTRVVNFVNRASGENFCTMYEYSVSGDKLISLLHLNNVEFAKFSPGYQSQMYKTCMYNVFINLFDVEVAGDMELVQRDETGRYGDPSFFGAVREPERSWMESAFRDRLAAY